jgi:hypothetical protein
MGQDEPTADNQAQTSNEGGDQPPAEWLLEGVETPRPAAIEQHPDIEADPIEVYQYRRAAAAERQAAAAERDAHANEVILYGLLAVGVGAVGWLLFESAVEAAAGY